MFPKHFKSLCDKMHLLTCMSAYTHTHTHTCVHINIDQHTYRYIHTYMMSVILRQLEIPLPLG